MDDIKCLVGRLISDRGIYIMNPVMGWVNPDLACMAVPPGGGAIDADQGNGGGLDACGMRNIMDEGRGHVRDVDDEILEDPDIDSDA